MISAWAGVMGMSAVLFTFIAAVILPTLLVVWAIKRFATEALLKRLTAWSLATLGTFYAVFAVLVIGAIFGMDVTGGEGDPSFALERREILQTAGTILGLCAVAIGTASFLMGRLSYGLFHDLQAPKGA